MMLLPLTRRSLRDTQISDWRLGGGLGEFAEARACKLVVFYGYVCADHVRVFFWFVG